jgi:CDP-glycerol glycerophosphotransferase (TagB/SpsB family)
VRAALEVHDVRVVYKPHPRVALSPDPAMAEGHRQILQLLSDTASRDPGAGHQAIVEGDVLAVFPGCDLIVTDVSSVGLDFLYLHTDKPIFITDRREAPQQLHAEVALSRCADLIDSSTIAALTATLAARLDRDQYRSARESMRRHYFGDLAPGESTERFLSALDELIAERDRLTGRPDGSTQGKLQVEFS